jgi:GT2 family glycosyltransferase
VFPNLNSGGSGGFSRCIIEALADKERHNLTHVILMDDDVEFTHFTLERTYRLLQLLKPEYEDAALGGAMFRLHAPNWQHAAGELCKGGLAHSVEIGMWNPKPNLDMNRVEDVVRSELTERTNYAGWWYFCTRLSDGLRANLSMPFFFQWDDLEYQLRVQNTIITMNGICLWHEDFVKKASMSRDYYVLRNKWISCAIHPETGYGKGQMKRQIIKFVARNIMEYRYRSADIWLRGAEDFFKGLEWLGGQNPQKLNTEIMRYATQMSPVQQLPFDFAYNLMKTERDYTESKLKRLWRRATLNGYLLPAKGEVTVPVIGINKSFVFRKKRVLNYDLDSQKGFITEKSYKEVWRVVMRLLRVLRTIDRDYEKTVNDYRAKYPQYVTEEFWRKYLDLAPKS